MVNYSPIKNINIANLANIKELKHVQYNPPCGLSKCIYFSPNCPYSSHSSCEECIKDDVQAVYLKFLLAMPPTFFYKD